MMDGGAAAAPYDGLFNSVVRRLRLANTIFGENVKLVLRTMSDEQWSLMKLPYLLAVPTVTRIEGGTASLSDYDSIIIPRSITFLAQFSGRGTEADWRAGIDIEIAERQLIGCLVNWRPHPGFRPTSYNGMVMQQSRAPAVKAQFVFVFREEIFLAPDIDPELCAALNTPMEIPEFLVSRGDPCALEPVAPHDPCEDPCDPCAPDRSWSMAEWLNGGSS